MSLAAPALLLGLLLLAPVLAAFLVRRRQEVLRVPSVLLFRAAAVSRTKSKRFRSLMRLLALAACLLAVASLVLAAARPSGAESGRTVAYVVDVSASMGEGSRGTPLAEARSWLRRALLGRGPGDRVLILVAGASPARLAGPTSSAEALDAAIERIEPTLEASDVPAAVELAAALLEHEASSSIVVVHDGGARLGAGSARTRGIALFEHLCERPGVDNLGLTTFASRPATAGGGTDARELLVTVATSSSKSRRARVDVEALGVVIASRTLEVEAGGEADLTLQVRTPARELVARVSPEDGLEDELSADDAARLGQPPAIQRRVVLVSATGDGAGAREFFVTEALRAAGVAEILRVEPSAVRAAVRPDDVVVALDRAPERAVEAPTLFVATREGELPIDGPRVLDGASGLTRLRSLEDRHPLLGGVSLDEVTIETAVTADVPRGGRALVELDGGPVVLAGGAGPSGWIYLGVDPLGSDLVLRVAFPVLVGNALGVLGGAARVATAETVPRSEVALVSADTVGVGEPPSRGLTLPVSLVAILVGFAALLLGLEVAAWRKGWAA